MKTEKQAPVIRPTDDEARRLARTLARGARFGAIAVLDPESGHPLSSRVLLGTDIDGAPVMLSSTLAVHTRAVLHDPRCSILVGEPGKGDPLAWPRLTILTEAERIKPDTESHSLIRARFLRRHPKARLYVDFPDFSFIRLTPQAANLNGGFGKAYNISGADLIVARAFAYEVATQELKLIAHIGSLRERAADLIVKHFFSEKSVGWAVVGVDPAGLDLAYKEQLRRIEFTAIAEELNGLIAEYSSILKSIP